MPGTVHLLVGAAIAALIPDLSGMVVISFFSHYLLDFIPHLDADTFAHEKTPYTWWQKATVIIDTVLALSLFVGLYLLRNESFNFLLGALVAIMPDILTPLENHPVFYPLRRIHEMFHWNKNRARWWSWYIPALVLPLLISLASLFAIWKLA